MAKTEASVEELVGMIERGELRLPEMQRRYVWRSTRVRDLLDSLYRGYPSGAILLWETDMTDDYVEFHARSAFSFLEGASLPEALVEQAAKLGMPGVLAGQSQRDLKEAATAYKVDTEAIALKVKQEFIAKEKAKKAAQPAVKAAKKAA